MINVSQIQKRLEELRKESLFSHLTTTGETIDKAYIKTIELKIYDDCLGEMNKVHQNDVLLNDNKVKTLSRKLEEISNKNWRKEQKDKTENKYSQQIKDLKNEENIKLKQLKDESNTISVIQRDLNKKKIDREREIGREHTDRIYLPITSFIIILILSFLELPFTYSAFNILRAQPIVSLTIAILISTTLTMGAHFLGRIVRQRIKNTNYNIIGFLLFVFCILVIQVTAHFRTLHTMSIEVDGVDDLLTLGFFDSQDLFFLIIGGFIFLISVIISFFSYDSDIAYEKILAEIRKIKNPHREQKRSIEEEFNHKSIELEEIKKTKLKSIDNKPEEIETQLHNAKKKYDELLKTLRELEIEVVSTYQHNYNRLNQEVRSFEYSLEKPKNFKLKYDTYAYTLL